MHILNRLLWLIMVVASSGLYLASPVLASEIPHQVTTMPSVDEAYANLPMYFEVNQGQTSSEVNFVSRGNNYSLFLATDQAMFVLPYQDADDGQSTDLSDSPDNLSLPPIQTLHMTLIGSNPVSNVIGENRLPGISNYFMGSDPSQWITDIPHYAAVRYQDVYSGIDLVYQGDQGELRYDFIVAPGSSPASIELSFAPVSSLELDANGDLLLQLADGGILRQRAPFTYQTVNGQQVQITSRFVLSKSGTVRFAVDQYDPALPLVIDPTLIYSTYLGGSSQDVGTGDIAVDSNGAAYVAGHTYSVDFPTTPGAYQPIFPSGPSSSITILTKLSPDGSSLEYSTFFPATRATDITVDATGAAYLASYTASFSMPVTPGAIQPVSGEPYDAFIAKFSPAGNALIFGTYLGGDGSDAVTDTVLDGAGNIYLVGQTTSLDFPTSVDAFDRIGDRDGDTFVAKLSADGSTLLYSTLLGGSGQDNGYGIAIDDSGHAYVTGGTHSVDFPTTSGAYQTAGGTGESAFLTKLSPTGSALIYSAYWGGSDVEDGGFDVEVDSSGAAYVVGSTRSTDFPTTPDAFDNTFNGGLEDAWALKMNPAGSDLIYSTFIGGSVDEHAYAVELDSSGTAYICGSTESSDFPTQFSLYPYQGDFDIFVLALNPNGTELISSTLIGSSGGDYCYGMDIDDLSNVYLVGESRGDDFPLVNPYQDTFAAGGGDIVIAKISLEPSVQNIDETSIPNNQAEYSIFDPAISKIGVLKPDELGLPGEQITWHITVTGGGTISATDVIVTDTLPVELQVVNVTTTKGTFNITGQTITLHIGTLAPGEMVQISILTTILSSPVNGELTNIATITGYGVHESTTATVNLVSGLPNTGFATP